MDATTPGAPRARKQHSLCCQEQDGRLFLFGGVGASKDVGKEIFAAGAGCAMARRVRMASLPLT